MMFQVRNVIFFGPCAIAGKPVMAAAASRGGLEYGTAGDHVLLLCDRGSIIGSSGFGQLRHLGGHRHGDIRMTTHERSRHGRGDRPVQQLAARSRIARVG